MGDDAEEVQCAGVLRKRAQDVAARFACGIDIATSETLSGRF
jgi:hypothetical protein